MINIFYETKPHMCSICAILLISLQATNAELATAKATSYCNAKSSFWPDDGKQYNM